MVTVEQLGDGEPMVFAVTVADSAGHTQHRVTLARTTLETLAPAGTAPSAFVRAAFAFLLERESKSDILASFDINVIKLYFPNFERDIGTYL